MLHCGHEPSQHGEHTTGTGIFTVDGIQREICWDCCADIALGQMLKDGKSFFYLTETDGKYKLTNWPGNLSFPLMSYREGSHNIGRTRTDVWFVGPDQYVWHGVQIGEWNQVCRVKRTKEVWKHAA